MMRQMSTCCVDGRVRRISAVLVVAVVLAATACGSNNSGGGDQLAETVETTTATGPGADDVEPDEPPSTPTTSGEFRLPPEPADIEAALTGGLGFEPGEKIRGSSLLLGRAGLAAFGPMDGGDMTTPYYTDCIGDDTVQIRAVMVELASPDDARVVYQLLMDTAPYPNGWPTSTWASEGDVAEGGLTSEGKTVATVYSRFEIEPFEVPAIGDDSYADVIASEQFTDYVETWAKPDKYNRMVAGRYVTRLGRTVVVITGASRTSDDDAQHRGLLGVTPADWSQPERDAVACTEDVIESFVRALDNL